MRIDNPIIPDKINITKSGSQATPTSGSSVIYVKADGEPYVKNDAGVERPLGHTIQHSGSALTNTNNVNFYGSGFTSSSTVLSASANYIEVDFNMTSLSISASKTVTIPTEVGSIVVGPFKVNGQLVLNGTIVIL